MNFPEQYRIEEYKFQ